MTNALECVACGCQDAAPGSSEAGWPVCSKCFSPMVASSSPKSGGTEAGDFNASLTMIVRPPARGPQSSSPTDSAVEPPPEGRKLPAMEPVQPSHKEEFNPSLTSIVRPSAGARRTSSVSEAPNNNEAIGSPKIEPSPTTGNKDDNFSPSLTSIIRPGAGMPPIKRDADSENRAGSVEHATGGGTGGTVRATRSDGSNSSDGSLRAGDLLDGRYLITKRIGQGGMGVVYKAVDQETESELAIKVLLPSLASSPAAMNDLRQEVAIAQQLTHQNLLRVNHLGIGQGLAYLVMEYIDGEDLETYRLRHGGKLPADVVRRIMTEMLAGLNFLHDRGIVHLDIKPQNIMVPRSGEAKLADFGISRTIRQQIEQQAEGQTSVGTLCFMAPEQLRGEICDRRADIYAVGVMLYQLLSGEFPFSTRSREEVVAWHLNSQIQIQEQEQEQEQEQLWSKILQSCLARRPLDRFSGCADILEILADSKASRNSTPHQVSNEATDLQMILLVEAGQLGEALSLAEAALVDGPGNAVAWATKACCAVQDSITRLDIDPILRWFEKPSNTSSQMEEVVRLRNWAAAEYARSGAKLVSDIEIAALAKRFDKRAFREALVCCRGACELNSALGEFAIDGIIHAMNQIEDVELGTYRELAERILSQKLCQKYNIFNAINEINKSQCTILWPGMWMIVDCKCKIYFDDSLLGEGSFKRGFRFEIQTTPGTHSLIATLSFLKKRELRINIPQRGNYNIMLNYDNAWGNWSDHISIEKAGSTKDFPR